MLTMHNYAPRVALGKPLTETEATMRERKWAESASNTSTSDSLIQ